MTTTVSSRAADGRGCKVSVSRLHSGKFLYGIQACVRYVDIESVFVNSGENLLLQQCHAGEQFHKYMNMFRATGGRLDSKRMQWRCSQTKNWKKTNARLETYTITGLICTASGRVSFARNATNPLHLHLCTTVWFKSCSIHNMEQEGILCSGTFMKCMTEKQTLQ